MTLSPDPVVISFPAPAAPQDGQDLHDVTRRLERLADELHQVRGRLLQTSGRDRHVRAAAHRLDDAAYACTRVLDELTDLAPRAAQTGEEATSRRGSAL